MAITGASAGLGRAIARCFAARGANVALLARGADRLAAAREELVALGVRALDVVCDVADEQAVQAAVSRIERELGPIDVWVNNAMVSVFSPISAMRPDEFRRVTEVTYLGYVWGTLAVLPRMRARGRGTIVQVGSALAHRSIPLQSAYCAAKHAVAGFTESLRCELLHDRSPVHVVSVEMPALNTPQFDWSRSRMPRRAQPVPPIFQPEVGADAVVWAAEHPRRRAVWVGLPVVEAIVGNRLVPGLLDRWLARTAYDRQQTDEPEVAGRQDNLFTPEPGDPGAHGRFDLRAHRKSLLRELRKHPLAALGAIAAAGAVASLAPRLFRSSRGPGRRRGLLQAARSGLI